MMFFFLTSFFCVHYFDCLIMIKVDHLSKNFGDFVAVDGLSFSVNAGEVLGFLGPNGAGKTTTMQMITGFLTPNHGSVSIFHHNVVDDPLAAKRLIGYLPEGAPLYGDMCVSPYLHFIANVRGFAGQARRNAVDKVVAQLELHPVLFQPIDTLSKGFKRRVGLAQAIIHDPQVLILDEPTDGLDPNQKRHVRQLIQNLSQDKIVIISTHILEEVEAVCSRAIIIASGKLIADDSPENLCRRSKFYGAVVLDLDEPVDVLKELQSLKNVASVVQDDSCQTRYRIFPKDSADLFKPLTTKAQKNDWPVAGLYIEKGRLDDVFYSLTGHASEKKEVACA